MKESRLFKIVYYILEKGHATAPELASKFEVSVRTIYRDVDVISSAGIPIYVTTGRNGGIQILDNYVLEKALFSDEEKQEILSALQSLSIVDNSYEKELLPKLSAIFHTSSESWFEVDFTRWGDHSMDNSKFEALKKATITHTSIRIDYISTHGDRTTITIQPIKLSYKSKDWYVKAFCIEKRDFRLYKINRIIDYHLLEEHFLPLQYPDEQSTRPDPGNAIVLRFSDQMAYRLYDEFDEKSLTKQDNGDYIVRANMPIDPWLVGYLLSYGPYVKVIEPSSLCATLMEEAKKIYEVYKP